MDEASFRRMYDETARRVYAYVRRRSDEATAETVVSEVFLKAWRHGDKLTGNPLPWLLVTARTTLYDHWRSEGRRQRLADEFTVLHALAEPGGCTSGALP